MGNTAPTVDTISLTGAVYSGDLHLFGNRFRRGRLRLESTYNRLQLAKRHIRHPLDSFATGTVRETLQLSSTIAQPDDVIRCVATATDADGAKGTEHHCHCREQRPDDYSGDHQSGRGGYRHHASYVFGDGYRHRRWLTTLAYEWFNGTTSMGSTNPITLSNATASPTDTITCKVVATDADGGTDNASGS